MLKDVYAIERFSCPRVANHLKSDVLKSTKIILTALLTNMKRVGILAGREVTFPESIINSINEKGAGKVAAEMITVGGIRLEEPKKYDVIIDRISHEVPYYRAMLKRMALEGTYIINDPFWWSADDKFFNYSLGAKLGVAIPKTVLLPQHAYIKDIVSDSLRNLEFPIDWEGIVEYVGFPAFLKPHDGGGWKNVSKVNSLEELWAEYNRSGTLCMTLQEGIEYDHFVRCYCVGREKVLIMPYDPSKPYMSGMQYVNVENYLTPEVHSRVERDVITLCKALGYDLNTVEFAIKDGVPYAIDFMNPAPDAELASVGEYNHNWIVNELTDFILEKLGSGFDIPEYTWSKQLAPARTPKKRAAAKSDSPTAKKTTSKTKTPAKGRKVKTAKADK
jgi:glutathione synthase/RimK-type ligase-like ATP-grasp enzyme